MTTIVKFNAQELRDAVAIINKVKDDAGRLTQVIFLTISGNSAYLFATNLWEISIHVKLRCSKKGNNCEVAIYKKMILDIIKEIEGDYVIFEIDGADITVRDEEDNVFELTAETDIEFGMIEPEDIPLEPVSTRELMMELNRVIRTSSRRVDRDVLPITPEAARFLIQALNILKKGSVKFGIGDKNIAVEVGNYLIEIRYKRW